jgi:hypothetical protein
MLSSISLTSTILVSYMIMASVNAFVPSQSFHSSQTPKTTIHNNNSNKNNNKSLQTLFCASADEIRKLNERSEAIPFLLRPQNCRGFVGDVGFDPFQFSDRWSMEYLREAELKHGRICMLAWSGWVAVDLGLRVYPVPEGWSNLNSLAAHDALTTIDPSDPRGWWGSPLAFVLYAIAIPEWYFWKSTTEMRMDGISTQRDAGDLGWDLLGFLSGKSEEEVNEMKLKELKHARLGMLAFSGVVAQTAVVGSDTFPYLP